MVIYVERKAAQFLLFCSIHFSKKIFEIWHRVCHNVFIITPYFSEISETILYLYILYLYYFLEPCPNNSNVKDKWSPIKLLMTVYRNMYRFTETCTETVTNL